MLLFFMVVLHLTQPVRREGAGADHVVSGRGMARYVHTIQVSPARLCNELYLTELLCLWKCGLYKVYTFP